MARQALNHLRGARRRQEDYVGNSLPEPIRTTAGAGEDTVLAESTRSSWPPGPGMSAP